MDTVSGACHVAIFMGRVTRAGMIFVPCENGISHNEVENAEPGDLRDGCNVLLHAMLEQAGVDEEGVMSAAALPCGLDDNGLPIGLHLVGPRFQDPKLLHAAQLLEERLPRIAPPQLR